MKRLALLSQNILALLALSPLLLSSAMAATSSGDLTLSGFGRIVAGALDTEQAEFKGYGHELSVKPHSLLGLQLDYQLTDTLTATAQGVLRSSETSDSELEWLFLTWTPEDNLTFRLGRQRAVS